MISPLMPLATVWKRSPLTPPARMHRAKPAEPYRASDRTQFTISIPDATVELLDQLSTANCEDGVSSSAFLDATTSENVARMIAMKSATDNADKMVKTLTMQYNRARQSQITTELSEIMGGVEAMG